MNSDTLLGLVNNTALLLALAVLSESIPLQKTRRSRLLEIFTGIFVGAIGLVVMLTPWQFSEGVIFDTRSILLSLTGLYNRAFFMGEMERLERGRVFPISIVVVDVDKLKTTNDKYGHAAGDALLKRVAQALTVAFRAEDVIARIGGDEFAVLLPGIGAVEMQIVLQRVLQVIRENNATQPETPLHLSIGMSTAEEPTSLSLMLKEADENMYREKRG
jgi:diguanylate cyclase (GGDEF)-like protein